MNQVNKPHPNSKNQPDSTHPSRREFVTQTATAASALVVAPTVLTSKRTDPLFQDEVIVGEGEFQYRIDHQWADLPSKFKWQTTHNVAVDSGNNVYVIHEGRRQQKDHPSIFVFSPDGKFRHAFGSQFQGGGHGIEVRKEGNQEFLYVAAYQQVKAFAKLTLMGEIVWFKKAPMESGVYAPGEDISTEANWTRKGFLPTNFAFLDDGEFLLVDGYGSFYVHRYDKDANWVSCFGGPGDGQGTFKTSHGIWIDKREGREPSIVVVDRAHHTLQYFTMEGKYIETIEGFQLPANIDIQNNLMMVPELKAQVTLLNEKNEVVAKLGTGRDRLDQVKNLRSKEDEWKAGEFVHPHDACFDKEGNIYVAEWVQTGRISKLTKI